MQLSESWVSIGLDLIDTYVPIDQSKALYIKRTLDTSKIYSYSNLEISFNRFISSYRKNLEYDSVNDLLSTMIEWAIALFSRAHKHHTYEKVKDNLFWLIETAIKIDWQKSQPLFFSAEKTKLFDQDLARAASIKLSICRHLFACGEETKALDYLQTIQSDVPQDELVFLLVEWSAHSKLQAVQELLIQSYEAPLEAALEVEVINTITHCLSTNLSERFINAILAKVKRLFSGWNEGSHELHYRLFSLLSTQSVDLCKIAEDSNCWRYLALEMNKSELPLPILESLLEPSKAKLALNPQKGVFYFAIAESYLKKNSNIAGRATVLGLRSIDCTERLSKEKEEFLYLMLDSLEHANNALEMESLLTQINCSIPTLVLCNRTRHWKFVVLSSSNNFKKVETILFNQHNLLVNDPEVQILVGNLCHDYIVNRRKGSLESACKLAGLYGTRDANFWIKYLESIDGLSILNDELVAEVFANNEFFKGSKTDSFQCWTRLIEYYFYIQAPPPLAILEYNNIIVEALLSISRVS